MSFTSPRSKFSVLKKVVLNFLGIVCYPANNDFVHSLLYFFIFSIKLPIFLPLLKRTLFTKHISLTGNAISEESKIMKT